MSNRQSQIRTFFTYLRNPSCQFTEAVYISIFPYFQNDSRDVLCFWLQSCERRDGEPSCITKGRKHFFFFECCFATKLKFKPAAVPSIYPGTTASLSQRLGQLRSLSRSADLFGHSQWVKCRENNVSYCSLSESRDDWHVILIGHLYVFRGWRTCHSWAKLLN